VKSKSDSCANDICSSRVMEKEKQKTTEVGDTLGHPNTEPYLKIITCMPLYKCNVVFYVQ